MLQEYYDTANELQDRIEKLIPTHPEILDMEDPWGLFDVDGFECEDLQPSLMQASFALSKAKQTYAKKEG